MGFGSYNTQIQSLNAAIIPWAKGLNTTESPIWVVDQYTGKHHPYKAHLKPIIYVPRYLSGFGLYES